MRGSVTLAMAIPPVPRDDFVQDVDHVVDNIGVGVFVDCDTGGGVRDKYRYHAILDALIDDMFLNRTGYIDKIRTMNRVDIELLHVLRLPDLACLQIMGNTINGCRITTRAEKIMKSPAVRLGAFNYLYGRWF